MVVVHAPHVVLEVPGPRETLAFLGTLTTLVGAVVGLVAVHAVSLALVSEKARSRGEAGVSTGLNLAAVRPQVGIDEFATQGNEVLVSFP